MDAATWAADLLIGRAEAAADGVATTYSGSPRLAIHGRALLLDDVQGYLSVRDYPAWATPDWRADADVAYDAARKRWAAGGDDDEVRAAAQAGVRL